MSHASHAHHRLLRAHAMSARAAPVIPNWPSYTGQSQLVGQSAGGRLTVYVDPTLGAAGLANANSLLQDADRIIDGNDAIFGTIGGPTSVIVFALGGQTDGTGGADHGGCDYVTGAAIELCAAFNAPQRVSALFEAELSECSMGGNLCGASTGEALSRWCAAELGNNALADFATAPTWVAQGMPDFVNVTAPTDGDPISTGCGMAFISWLRSLGFAMKDIAPKMVALGDNGTFAQLYQQLTGKDAGAALTDFMAAVNALPTPIADDDPFAGVAPPMMANGAISQAEANRLLGLIVDSVAAGHSPERMADRLSGALSMMGREKTLRRRVDASCSVGSHRLAPVH